MPETLLNIYLIIEKGFVSGFKAIDYSLEGPDDEKIKFLKSRAKEDYQFARLFNAPRNSAGQFMKYSKFSKLESQGMQFQLFEEIFSEYKVPQNPLICVTPVVDGIVLSD